MLSKHIITPAFHWQHGRVLEMKLPQWVQRMMKSDALPHRKKAFPAQCTPAKPAHMDGERDNREVVSQTTIQGFLQ